MNNKGLHLAEWKTLTPLLKYEMKRSGVKLTVESFDGVLMFKPSAGSSPAM